jgi:hypothetical protein
MLEDTGREARLLPELVIALTRASAAVPGIEEDGLARRDIAFQLETCSLNGDGL